MTAPQNKPVMPPPPAWTAREPENEYHARSKSGLVMSSGMLKKFRDGPYAYRQAVLGLTPEKDSAAYRFGRAVHKIVLEGIPAFNRAYAVGGPINEKTGKSFGVGTKAHDEWLAANGYSRDLDVIGRADYVYSTTRAGTKAKASTDEESVDGVKVKVRQLTFDGGVEQDCKARIGYELPPTMPLSWDAFQARLGNVRALADEIRELWNFLPEDKSGATLQWLGVNGLGALAEANRSKLSQLRNRLLEAKAAAAGEDDPPPDDPGGPVLAAAG